MKLALLISLLFLISLPSLGCKAPLTFHIGVVPWAPAAMNQIWASRLNKHLNDYCINATFGSAKSFEEFLKKTLKGDFQLADVPPHMASYLILHRNMNAIAIEDWKAEVLFITKSTSNIHILQDMKNQPVILPDPLSMVSYVAHPKVSEYTNKLQYVSDHHMVLKGVLNDQAPIGVLISPLLNSLKSVVKDKIRIIHKVNRQLPGVLISTKSIKPNNSKRLVNALSQFDLGNDKIWQKWHSATPERVKQLHIEQAPYVKRLRQEGW